VFISFVLTRYTTCGKHSHHAGGSGSREPGDDYGFFKGHFFFLLFTVTSLLPVMSLFACSKSAGNISGVILIGRIPYDTDSSFAWLVRDNVEPGEVRVQAVECDITFDLLLDFVGHGLLLTVWVVVERLPVLPPRRPPAVVSLSVG